MRILMLLENDYTEEARVPKEIKTLLDAGHSVTLAAITSSGESVEDPVPGVRIYRKHIPLLILKSSVGALKLPFYFNFWKKYVTDILRNEKADAVHIHDLPLSVIGIWLKNKYGTKVVIDLHENYPGLLQISPHINTITGKLLSSDIQWREYEKDSLMHADRIITVVKEMKERIAGIGIPPEKIFILENTSYRDTGMTVKFSPSLNEFNIIYLGGLTYHRGLQYVIEGMALIDENVPVRLQIIGSGSYQRQLQDLAEGLSLDKRVAFIGKLPKEDARSSLAQANAGLIPHMRSEQGDNSSPNKLYDYMAIGLPVLSSDCTSVKRIIDETSCGLTYKFDSPADFADKVMKMYLDPQKMKEFSENGIIAVRKKYNWEISAQSLVKLYAGL